MSSHHESPANPVLLLDHQLLSQVREIPKLTAAVSKALAGHPDLAFSVNLCLEELITNTIHHGLKDAPDHFIQVRMSLSDDRLEVVLKDDAPPYDPFNEAPVPDLTLDVEDRPIGGLGVHLVKSLMDEVRASCDDKGNLIVLLKTLRP